MIPKIIHYCWFGNNSLPLRLEQCINSWKEFMPEWNVRCWNEQTFDVNASPWTKEAYDAGKYAFVSDYVRLKALYEVGGIYLDTDVKLIKDLTPIAKEYDAFMGFETNDKLTSAIIGVVPNHPLIKCFFESYSGQHFSHNIVAKNVANVLMMTDVCKSYGLVANNEEQEIIISSVNKRQCIVHIFPREYFCPLDFWHNMNLTDKTYAIHYFDASWLDENTKRRIQKERCWLYKTILNIKSKIARFV